jgi:hypothetical protein
MDTAGSNTSGRLYHPTTEGSVLLPAAAAKINRMRCYNFSETVGARMQNYYPYLQCVPLRCDHDVHQTNAP